MQAWVSLPFAYQQRKAAGATVATEKQQQQRNGCTRAPAPCVLPCIRELIISIIITTSIATLAKLITVSTRLHFVSSSRTPGSVKGLYGSRCWAHPVNLALPPFGPPFWALPPLRGLAMRVAAHKEHGHARLTALHAHVGPRSVSPALVEPHAHLPHESTDPQHC